MSKSLVIIAPIALRDTVNAAAEGRGHGPNNLCVPLSDGGSVITHYGNRMWTSDEFHAEFNDVFPAELRNACIIDWREHEDRAGHWDAVLAANNLERVIEDAIPE